MKRLYLTSTVHTVAEKIAKDFSLNSKNNKLVFILTATEDKQRDTSWVESDKNALIKAGFDVFDYTISGKNEKQIREDLKEVDFIYVEGGNTYYLLQEAQKSNFIELIKDFILKENKVYIGTSAGSIIAAPDTYPALRLDDASLAPDLKGYAGFGLVDFIIFPHWGSTSFKDVYMDFRLKHSYEGNGKTILLRDSQYVEVKDEWYRIVEV